MNGFSDGVSYYKGDGFAVASLSYDGGNMNVDRSMILLLPDAPTGLGSLLTSLTPGNWSDWQKKLNPMVEMDLALPRFTLKYDTSLKGPLKEMGMRRAFTLGEADLAPMGLPFNRIINSVKHMTLLDVNEKGTEAIAVTGMDAGAPGGAAPEVEKVVFHVDRPFVCAIVDNTTETILFIGIVRDPSVMN
jgi:serpin B